MIHVNVQTLSLSHNLSNLEYVQGKVMQNITCCKQIIFNADVDSKGTVSLKIVINSSFYNFLIVCLLEFFQETYPCHS
jgi:glutamine cyclotransferase